MRVAELPGPGASRSSSEIWSKRENDTQANPFYSPALECHDKGGLLPLPLLYDYQYVLGLLPIQWCPNRP